MEVKVIAKGKFESFNKARKEWETECNRIRQWQTENTVTESVVFSALRVTENGVSYFADPRDLSPVYRKNIPAKGDTATFEGIYGEARLEWVTKTEKRRVVPAVDLPAEPSPQDYFGFCPDEAVAFARERGYKIGGGFHTSTSGRSAHYGRDIRPEDERFTFVRTLKKEFVKFFTMDLDEDGIQRCRVDRYTRHVVLIFEDGWAELEVVEELWEAVDPSPVGTPSTSMDADGLWNK